MGNITYRISDKPRNKHHFMEWGHFRKNNRSTVLNVITCIDTISNGLL